MITVKKADLGCLQEIQRLEKLCFSLPCPEDVMARQLQSERYVFLCASERERLLGYAGFSSVLDEGYVDNVAVDPSARRQGIGRQLMEELVRQAQERGLAFLTLEVRAGNEPARRLYGSCGFREVGRQKNYYEKPREDAILMTRFFPSSQGE